MKPLIGASTAGALLSRRPAFLLLLVVLAALALLAVLAVANPLSPPVAEAQPTGDEIFPGIPDVYLSMSAISLTERDDATDITVTATLLEASTEDMTITLALESSPLLTPGVTGGAAPGTDYTTTFGDSTKSITIPAGSSSGTTTFAIDPTYDTSVEGDEAIILSGSGYSQGGIASVLASTDLIIQDGPYLSFPKYIYGSLHYPGQSIAVTVEEAINKTAADSTVSYSLTKTEPSNNPLGLRFNPETRQLTGTAQADADVPDAGLITRYTITARDSAGHEATTLISVAVVNDVCSSTKTTWFHATDQPPAALVRDCNVLLAARDTLRGTATLNWSTDTLITTPWHGITFHANSNWISDISLRLRRLNGTIPPVLGHLAGSEHSAGDPDLTLILGGDYRGTNAVLENKLTGPIPPELGLLARMTVLALSYNNLSGPIPRELANSGELFFLYLSNTDKPADGATGPAPPGVSGPIPPELSDLPLKGLTIAGNPGVTGHIPWQLGKIVSSDSHPGLQVLNLSGNSLEGTIPWQLGRFGKAQQLALSHNGLTGGIPWQLGILGNEEAALARRIVDLHLNGNQLTGHIPPQLSNIANLRVLSLSENRLTGKIPMELGGLSKLQHLFLGDNQLTGSIPAELGRLPQLQTLSLSCNGLSEAVPTSISEMTALTTLNLHGNPALDISERPDNLQRGGLKVTRTGQCEGESSDPLPTAIPTPAVTTPGDEGRPAWLWWVIGVLVVGAGGIFIGLTILIRRRFRP